MTNGRLRLAMAGMSLFCGLLGIGPQDSSASEGYTLLRLGGTWVKWGSPALGTRAHVTYAFATVRLESSNARNCRSIMPLNPLLQRLRISPDSFSREVKSAFDAWAQAANISFSRVSDPDKADIVIGAQRYPHGRAYSNVEYKPAAHKGTRTIRKSLICLNPAKDWKIGFDGNLDSYDLRYTFIHEIGHAIGLDHPGPHGQVMSFQYDEDFRRPQSGDVNGAIMLYGGIDADAASAVRRAANENMDRTGTADRNAAVPQLSLGEKR